MATPDIAPYNKYQGNGSTTQFSVGFPYINKDFIHVYIKRAEQDQEEVSTSDWEWVNDVTIRFPATGSSETVLATGDVLVVQRETPTENEFTFTNQKRLFPKDVMDADDLEMQIIQEQARDIGRALKMQPTSPVQPEVLIDEVERIYESIDNIDTVADDIDNVNTVAGDKTNVDTIAGAKANVDTVAGAIGNVNAVGGSIANVNTVAGSIANVNAVAGNAANINAVASNSENINQVAADSTAINDCHDNMAAIQAAPDNASAAATSAEHARIWAEGDDDEVEDLGGTHSSLGSAGLSYAYANSPFGTSVEEFAANHDVVVNGEKGDQGDTGPQGPTGPAAKINGVNSLTLTATDGLELVQNDSTATVSGLALQTAVNSKLAQKPDGSHDIVENNKITKTYLPDFVLGQLIYAGVFVPSTAVATLTTNGKAKLGTSANTITLTNDTTAITGYEANEGCFYLCTADGTFAGISLLTGDWLISTGTSWQKVDNTDAVTGIKGDAEGSYRIGNVNITLDNVAPAQSGNSGKVLMTDGTNGSWQSLPVSSVTVDGVSVVVNGVAAIPNASGSNYGVTKLSANLTSISDTLAATASMGNNLAKNIITGVNTYSSSSTYSVGDKVRNGQYYYECNTAITSGHAWNASEWTQITIQGQIDEIKEKVISLTSSDSITLADNTIYKGGTQTALTVAVPSSGMDVDFVSQICFKSGATATTFTQTAGDIVWDERSVDLTDGVFVPVANKTYTLIVFYNGFDFIGLAEGVENAS